MAITLGSLIEMTVVQLYMGQIMLNAWQYQVDGSAFLVEPVQIAEAYWNHIKTTYRGIISSGDGAVFQSINILELNNPAGDYAEFSIPIGEKAGTRNPASLGDQMPPFASVGVRLTVGTRATRPGQKRFAGMHEGDNAGGVVGAGLRNDVNALMAVMTEPAVLGAPAATIVLNPIVTRRNASGAVTASQPVVGWVQNPNVTTQNSRKFGRGI